MELTLFIHALCRIMLPRCLMPATTALGTADSDGRKLGVLAGCNVVMPNLSPEQVRKKYMLYDNKAGTDLTAAEGIALLRRQMEEIGYEDCFYGEGVCLIECANLIEEILPAHYRRITVDKDLEKGFDYRRITIEVI